MILNQEQIKEIIPHRHEMLLIDEIVKLEKGVSATGRKHLTDDCWFFKGHFPQEPVMPGVLMIEACAQVGCVALLSLEENKGKTGYFAGIDKVKFKQKVVPGDVLDLEILMTRQKGPIGTGEAKGFVDGKLVFQAILTFAIM